MAISVTCQCGKKLTIKDEMLGRTVKCPGCMQVVYGPGATSTYSEPQSGGGGRFVPLMSGCLLGVLTTVFCFGVGAGGAYWLIKDVLAERIDGLKKLGGKSDKTKSAEAEQPPEKTIIGKWAGDADAFKKSPPKGIKDEDLKGLADVHLTMELEFKEKGPMTMTLGPGKSFNATWKVVESEGKKLTIEVTKKDDKDPPSTNIITVLDKDHIRMARKGESGNDEREFAWYFKRNKD